jgi:probable HAF family extracellular repeat protein
LGAAPFYLWSSGGAVQNLNTTIDPAITSVVEINDAGQIIGTYTTSGGASHAFLYTPGSGIHDLGTLGGATSAPTGLNGNGEVLGTSLTSGGVAHAFLWTSADGMEDITAIAGVSEVRRLNDNRQTLTGTSDPTLLPNFSSPQPKLVQLQVSHDAPPVARFTWSCEHKKCYFDASSSTDDVGIVSYAWDLGKTPRGTATGVKVTAVYPHGGSPVVTLTVTDTKGQTSSVTQTITTP